MDDQQKTPPYLDGGDLPKDDKLWDSMRAGDTRSFEEIFRTFYPVLCRYGMKFSNKEEEIKDCIQSLFLQIWERRQFLGPTSSVKNYLLASLRRLIHKNSESGLEYVFKPNLDFQVELSIESKIIASQAQAESVELLRLAFEKLPPRQKEAIYLRFYDDQSFNEIANIMGISVRATYKLIYKGLDSLQEQFEGRHSDIGHLLLLLFLVTNQAVTLAS